MQDVCIALVAPDGSSHSYVHTAVVLVPDIIFIVFLAINARRSHDILTRNPSTIMWTYYCLVWALSLCTFAHTCLQMAGTVRDGSEHLHLWNVLWLINRFVMVMLEVSVITFLLHGYIGNSAVALRRTAVLSCAIAIFDAALKSIFIWGLDVPLHAFGGQDVGEVQADMVWSKWGFWMAHSLVLAAAYFGMLLLPLTRWRDLLPSKDTFHYYVRVLFTVNLVGAFGALLIGLHVGAGYCLYGFANVAYLGMYAPLLYVTFLASFFQSDDVDLENYYYSEMSEAGFLDFSAIDDPFIGIAP